MKTAELEKQFGKSQQKTDVLGLGKWKLGDIIEFVDGSKKKLIHIERRNMAVDLLRFDDGTELFTEDIKDNFKFSEKKKKTRNFHPNSYPVINA